MEKAPLNETPTLIENGLKTFKIFSGCHIKTCQSLKQSAIVKVPSNDF